MVTGEPPASMASSRAATLARHSSDGGISEGADAEIPHPFYNG